MKLLLWRYILSVLCLVLIIILLAITYSSDGKLHIVACNVGQGDSFLIYFKSKQILVDGGPNNDVLKCLAKYIPFWDKDIEVVILTHPEKDHYTGLIDVIKYYKVKNFISTPLYSGTHEFNVLKNSVGGNSVKVINPYTSQIIKVGLIYLDILHPSRTFLVNNLEDNFIKNGNSTFGEYSSKLEANEFSVVFNLRFKNFDALFMGDLVTNQQTELFTEGEIEDIEYIKIPHHGSKNNFINGLLELTKPEIAVISVGKNNTYGHPDKELLKILYSNKLDIYRTDINGDIEVVSDGDKYWVVP